MVSHGETRKTEPGLGTFWEPPAQEHTPPLTIDGEPTGLAHSSPGRAAQKLQGLVGAGLAVGFSLALGGFASTVTKVLAASAEMDERIAREWARRVPCTSPSATFGPCPLVEESPEEGRQRRRVEMARRRAELVERAASWAYPDSSPLEDVRDFVERLWGSR